MTDALAAYTAARESAAFFDLTGWTILDLAGRDAAKFLHNFCTNDIKNLAPGQGCEAFVTNVKARVVGHLFASLDPPEVRTGITLIATPGAAAPLVPHLERYIITEDVTITDATAERGLFLVTGPSALDLLRRADFDLIAAATRPGSGRLSVWPEQIQVARCPARRIDLLGLPSVLFEFPPALVDVDELRERFSNAGIAGGNADTFDALRIEACFPLYGTDITEDNLAPEVGRPSAISYSKGCYLGQEPIARIDALGHVNRLLRGLRLDSGRTPEPGTAVLADDKQVGAVTSSTTSPADGRPVALAYIRTKFAEPGTAVSVQTPAGEIPAAVFRPPQVT